MPILLSEETTVCYQIVEAKLISPYEHVQRPMEVRLFQREVHTGLFESVSPKPIVRFYLVQNEQEIPPKDWTVEMKRMATHCVQQYPVPQAGAHYTGLGKALIGLGLGAVLVAAASIFYLWRYQVPREREALEALVQLPQVGDRYYGMVQLLPEGGGEYGWVKVIGVHPEDSMVTYVWGTQRGPISFEPLEVAHDTFETTARQGKFNANKTKRALKFRTVNATHTFELMVLGNSVEGYKINVQ